MIDKEELRRLAQAATPGPWSAFIARKTFSVDIGAKATGKRPNVVDWLGFDGTDLPIKQNRNNTEFIAAANPAVVLELLDEITQLREINAGLRSHSNGLVEDKRKLRAEIDVMRKQEPVAWFEKSSDLDAWFLAYSYNPKAETKPLYLAPGAQEVEDADQGTD